ncbi:MAG: hypothetical protein O7D94_10880 [Planctomycetota bacterium]|nr:hypothetical protein [Planctomycetota bacterium]
MDQSSDGSQELGREHLAALDVLRITKNLFFWLAIVAIVAQVGSWYVVRHTDKLDNADRAITVGEASSPTQAEIDLSRRWARGTESAVSLAGFVGRVSVVMVGGLMVLALLVSLSARLGGAAGITRAVRWSLLALALLVPWDTLTPGAVSRIPAAFCSFDELNDVRYRDISATAADNGDGAVTWSETARFSLYPLVLAVVLVASQLSFRGGYRKIVLSPVTRLPLHEV